MKAVAFANNDMAVVAWTFGGKLPGCVGFAVYRIDVRAGTETCLPAMATFEGQQATPGRTTADDPVQKFFWKDVFAKRGGTYKYRIVPMQGAAGSLTPMHFGPAISNQIQLSPHLGALSAYFNRGILATQATARALASGTGSLADRLDAHIMKPGDTLRQDLAGEMIEALTTLSDEALHDGEVFCGLYEFQDPEAIAHLAALGPRAHLVLSNMPGTGTDDTYADERKQIHDAGADVTDRFMKSGHIGHNKFQVLDRGGPQAVLFGSTNWTSHGLCAQTNNSIIARSPALAQAYRTYWDRLRDDTQGREGAAIGRVPTGERGQDPADRPRGRQRHRRTVVLAEHRRPARPGAWRHRGGAARPGRSIRRDLARAAGDPVPGVPARLAQHCRGGRGRAEGQARTVRARRRDRVRRGRRVLHGDQRRHGDAAPEGRPAAARGLSRHPRARR